MIMSLPRQMVHNDADKGFVEDGYSFPRPIEMAAADGNECHDLTIFSLVKQPSSKPGVLV